MGLKFELTIPFLIIVALVACLAVLLYLAVTERARRAAAALASPPKVADVEGFVGMLLAACESADLRATLDQVLSLPDSKRRDTLRVLIEDLRNRRAPRDLIDAFICLQDDETAEKAYVAIYQCARGEGTASLA
jgi:hypothetical protein